LNKYKEFFEEIIGFDKFIELRIFGMQKYPVMKFAENVNELILLMNKYKNYNLYIGVNPRNAHGGKASNVTYRRNIIFDIESVGDKPKLTNAIYMNKLKATINHVCAYMKKQYNINPNAIVKSGRGLHLYFSIEPLYNDNHKIYERWYSGVVKYINETSPYHTEIKCDPPVKDLARIFGCPGTVNVKYDEKPLREIMYFNRTINKCILNILKDFEFNNKIIEKKIKRGIGRCSNKHRYTNKNILDAPEFQVWKFKPRQGTSLNNKLRLAGKLLIDRDSITDIDKVSKFISECGYPYKDMSFDRKSYTDYEYSESLLNSYVLNNWQWSVEAGYKLPYRLHEEYKISCMQLIDKDNVFYTDDFKLSKICNYAQLVNMIKAFNNKYCVRGASKITYYSKELAIVVNNNLSLNFKKFVVMNNLFNRLKYLL
jgi:hypothetical protein